MRFSQRKLALPALSLLFAMLAAWSFRSSRAPESPAERHSAGPAGDAEVAELRARLEQLERNARRAPAAGASTPTPELAHPPPEPVAEALAPRSDDPEPEPLTHAQEIAMFQRYFAALDELRQGERQDAHLERLLRERSQEAMEKSGMIEGSAIESIACGTRTCLVEASHRPGVDPSGFMHRLVRELGEEMPTGSAYHDPERDRTRLYLARRGHRLPSVDSIAPAP